MFEEQKWSLCLTIQEDIVVARAPGRLDVMGGIADYSGSLVLLVNSLFVKTNFRFISFIHI